MTQLNIHMSPEFQHDLQKFMKVRHIKTKAEAVRTAIKESLAHSVSKRKPIDFSTWVGLGKQVPVNKKLRFKSDDDFWK